MQGTPLDLALDLGSDMFACLCKAASDVIKSSENNSGRYHSFKPRGNSRKTWKHCSRNISLFSWKHCWNTFCFSGSKNISKQFRKHVRSKTRHETSICTNLCHVYICRPRSLSRASFNQLRPGDQDVV
jgi:hypothetical protein